MGGFKGMRDANRARHADAAIASVLQAPHAYTVSGAQSQGLWLRLSENKFFDGRGTCVSIADDGSESTLSTLTEGASLTQEAAGAATQVGSPQCTLDLIAACDNARESGDSHVKDTDMYVEVSEGEAASFGNETGAQVAGIRTSGGSAPQDGNGASQLPRAGSAGAAELLANACAHALDAQSTDKSLSESGNEDTPPDAHLDAGATSSYVTLGQQALDLPSAAGAEAAAAQEGVDIDRADCDVYSASFAPPSQRRTNRWRTSATGYAGHHLPDGHTWTSFAFGPLAFPGRDALRRLTPVNGAASLEARWFEQLYDHHGGGIAGCKQLVANMAAHGVIQPAPQDNSVLAWLLAILQGCLPVELMDALLLEQWIRLQRGLVVLQTQVVWHIVRRALCIEVRFVLTCLTSYHDVPSQSCTR